MKNIYAVQKSILTLLLIIISASLSWAQVPATYYDGISGTGYTLKTNLHNLINGHTSRTYDQLWTDMQSTDNDGVYEGDGTVLDMYSENPTGTDPYNFTWVSNQCGTYANEGDCYNREHSFPKSWFSDGYPMYTDLFHLYPTDGKVNGYRSNYPFGEVSSPTTTSLNGSKLGPCSYPGYTGTVFEPIDEFKGDFARTYFYMATRYENVISGWSSVILDGSSDKVYVDWYLDMMIEWHQNDPVSQKEINRNNAVYNIQNNANPFIDHPEWVCEIWNTLCGPNLSASPSSISGYTYVVGNGPSASQSFELSGSNLDGSQVTVTAPTNYEISTDNSTFSTSLTINYTAPDLNATTIYIRLKAGLAQGTYNNENITCSDNGTATNITVSNSGEVTGTDPTLTVNPSSLSGFSYVVGSGPSNAQSFELSGTYLDGSAVSISAPTNYEISLDNATYQTGLNIGYTAPDLSATTIYVRLKAGLAEGTYNNETVICNDNGTAPNATVTNSGEVTPVSTSCANETFSGISTSESSYATRTWTGDDGGTWTATEARTDQSISGKAICFKGYTESSTISGGIGDLTITTIFPFSDGTYDLDLSVNGTSVGTISVSETQQTTTITGINTTGDIVVRISSDGSKRPAIDDLSWTCYSQAASPTLTANPVSLSGYSYTEGSGPSASQNFSLSAINLDATDIIITGPTNFEVSLDDTNFGASQTITTAHANYDGTALTATTVYVRLKAGLTAGTYNSENVTVSGGGTSNITVANSGQVTAAPNPEPDNYPTSFTATAAGSSQTDLSWTDAGGTNLPNGYLIKANTTGTFTDPTDTNDPIEDTDLSDGTALIKVAHGSGASHSFTGLSASTTYYFKIWPYSNSGSDIDFKTDGPAPTANAATDAASGSGCASDLIISEYIEGSSNNKYIEIYNGTGSSIDLSNYEVRLYSNGSATPSNTEALTGTLADGEVFAIGNSSGIIYTEDISSSVCFFNGNDALELYNTSKGQAADIFGCIGEDPGSAWTDGSYTTVDKTLVRNADITGGVTSNPASGFPTLRTEWTQYTQDENSYIGSHTMDCGSAADTNSEVTAGVGSEPATIVSTVDSDGEEIMVFDFTFTDAGTSDGLATIIDEIILTQGTGNDVADWTNAIAGTYLSGSDLTSDLSGTIAATDITFTDAGMISIADGTNETYTLKIYLKSDLSAVSDNDNLAFALNYSDISVDAAGSSFGSGAPESGSTNVAVDINATEMRYITQPSDVNVGASISPAVETAFTDVNGNIDLDAAGNTVRITASGATLNGSPVDAIIDAAGIASFASLQFTTAGTGVTLSANDLDGVLGTPGGYSKTSASFNVTEVNACGLEEFHDGTTPPDGWSFTSIGTYTTSGNFGTSSPSLQFDATGDRVTTAEVTNPAQLSFWLKGQGTDASSSLEVEGYNGSSWETIETISNLPTTGTTITYNSGVSNYSRFQFTYTKSAGNLAFDDVYVDCVPCETPTQNASDFVFTNVQGTQMDISFTLGSDAEYAVLIAKEGSPVDWTPTDAQTYTANSVFGNGTELGTGNYAVYYGDGNDLAVTLSGLTSNTTYYFTAFVYNNCTAGEQYLISGALTGAQGTQDYVATGNITGEPFCATSAASANVDIPFTYGAISSFPTSTTFTAQLSDASGSFASPTNIGSLSSDESGSQTISGTIPPGTASGSGYRIRVNSDSPAHTGTDNGSDLEIINAPTNVTSVSATGGLNEVSLSWNAPSGCFDEIIVAVYPTSITNNPDNTSGYAVSSSDYNDTSNPNLTAGSDEPVVYSGSGNSVTITGLASAESYYFKIFTRYNTDWSSGVEISGQTVSETKFQPGDLVMIGYDADIDNILTTGDRVYLATFVPIVPGTSFSYVNSRFEAGAAANVRTMEWHGGSDNPDEDPGIFRFTYNGVSNISEGSIIAFDIALAEPQAVYINETNRTADFAFTTIASGRANISAAKGDQLWLVQGDFTDQGTYHTLDGSVLFGLTVAEAWVPLSNSCSGSTDGSLRESRLHPDLKCFNLDLSVQANTFYYYLNSANHNDSKRSLLTAIMESANWDGSTGGDGNLNITEDYTDPYDNIAIGKPFTISDGNSAGYWLGVTTNWFDCRNWEGLAVPDENTNVIINAASANIADIDYTAAGADEFEGIAKCKNLTISGKSLILDTEGDVLEVQGDLSITGGSLDMNDVNPAGSLYLFGDWNNQVGTSGFAEGDGRVYLSGTETQTIYGSGGESFKNLYINSDSQKTLLSNIAVTSELNISTGVLDAGTYTLSGGGNLTMTGGELRLAKLSTTLPELTGAYTISGGTIELYGTGDQILRGTKDYYSLTFSNSGTKTITSALSDIDGTVTISGNAVLDTEGGTFSGTADLVMTDNSLFRMAALNSTLPQLTGNYSLTGGTVELYGSGDLQTHSLKTGVTYNKIELNASAANLNYNEANVVLSSGTLTLRSVLNVNSPAVFKTGATSIIEGAGTFNLNDGATLKFGHVDGITTDILTGNIRTSGRSFSQNASYALTGSSSPQITGNALPTSIVNFYLEKTNTSDEASLGSVIINGDMILREGLLKITSDYTNPLVLENASGEGDLTIEAGAVLQIEPNTAMTIKGDEFNNDNLSSRLVIKSDATGTGSLIMTPTIAEATVERYVTGDQWHFMYPPLSAVPTASYIQEGSNTNPNLYSYDESQEDYWTSTTIYGTSGWTSETGSTNLSTDKGYIFNRYQMADKTFSQTGGVLNASDKDFAVSYFSGSHSVTIENGVSQDWTFFDGWNLAGNPFASAIDWDAVTKTDVEAGIYCFDGSNYQYYVNGGSNSSWDIGITVNNSSPVIPAGQGFMVKANSGGGTLTIPAAARIHDAEAFWKNKQSAANILRLQIEKDGFTDETVIRTLPPESNVTDEHDGMFDAYKRFSWDASKPQLYSHTPDNSFIFAINSMTEIIDQRVVPLGLYIGEAGEYEISITENNFENMHLWLEDTHTEEMTNLRETNNWKLNQTAEDNSDRYILHFDKNSQPESNVDLSNQAFKLNETIYFELPEKAFTDSDFGDTLTFSVSLSDGSELPEWLSFNPKDLSFSGEALELGKYSITIKASDTFNETARNNFELEIYETTGENDADRNSVSIYPNPADEKLHVRSLSEKIKAVKIVDISGKLIIQKNLAEESFSMDISKLSQGMYFIEIQTISETIRKSFIKQ